MSKESAESAKKTIDKERTVKKRAARSIVAPKIDEEAYTVRSSSKETIFIPGTPKPVKEKKPAKVIASPVNVSQAPVKKREARVIKAPGGMMPNEDERPVSTQQPVISSGGNGWPDRPPTPRVMLQPEGAKLSRELTSAVRTDTIKAEVRGQIRAEVQKQAQEAAEKEKSKPEVTGAESQAPGAMAQPLGNEAAKPGPMKLNLPEPPKRDGIPVGPARPGAQPQPAQAPTGPNAQAAAVPNIQGGTGPNTQAAGPNAQPAAAPVPAGAVSPAVPEAGQTQRSVKETVVNVPDSTGKPRKVVKTVVTTTTTTYESVDEDEYKELTGT
ncbi:MAG: hypothetical protein K6E63_09265, partial [Lachnospiraceae bacterium]|nr:hypothetical protein [Lachnospiraceae bacterium]